MVEICSKKELRKDALKKREILAMHNSIKPLSSIIISKIINSKDFINSNNIALYYPYKNEVDISPLLNIKNKIFYLPKCIDNELYFTKYYPDIPLAKGKYGIMEAKGKPVNPDILDIIYIPALLANSRNYRLGYGLGYYDRFFSKHKIKAKKVIVIPSIFINDNFIEDSFDYRLDEIISG